MRNVVRKWVRYPIEAAAAWVCVTIFGLMPANTASAIGGWIGRTIGPHLPVNRHAIRSINIALPEATPEEKTRIIRGMWDNLGRVVAEYAHLEEITDLDRGYIETAGMEHIDAIRDGTEGGLLISGHFSNWEIFGLTLRNIGIGSAYIYRVANNPTVEKMLVGIRRLPASLTIPKGTAGARQTIDLMRQHGRIGVLVDQKMNDGISVPFFGHNAMTVPGPARLAHRFDRPVIPFFIERLEGCRFRVKFYPAIRPKSTGDIHHDVEKMMLEFNAFLEQRIKERPELWLWLHRRWPEGSVATSAQAAPVPPEAGGRAASGTS